MARQIKSTKERQGKAKRFKARQGSASQGHCYIKEINI
jgi:hypothetical protein